MGRILCIEDSPEYFLYIKSILNGNLLTQCESLRRAFDIANADRKSFDLILMDINLPDGNALKSLQDLKTSTAFKDTPIIILSNDEDVLTKVAAFGMGVEDYIVKNMNVNELKARVESKLRATEGKAHTHSIIEIGDLILDSDHFTVNRIGTDAKIQEINLTPSEFKLLNLLCRKSSQIFSRDQIIDYVWGVNKHVSERTVDANISNIRKKLLNSKVKISTIVGVGYKCEVTRNLSAAET